MEWMSKGDVGMQGRDGNVLKGGMDEQGRMGMQERDGAEEKCGMDGQGGIGMQGRDGSAYNGAFVVWRVGRMSKGAGLHVHAA
eukprot:scaffold37902_cov15-Tisochrysis_lutea.AAC.1